MPLGILADVGEPGRHGGGREELQMEQLSRRHPRPEVKVVNDLP